MTSAVLPTASFGALALPAFAALGAGSIHAAAIGVHSEHRQAVLAFTVVAAFQVGWGALALTQSSRRLALAGAIGNAMAVGGWVLAKTVGLGFVEGLGETEPLQAADGIAALLGAVAAAAAIAVFADATSLNRANRAGRVRVAAALAVALLAIPGMVLAGSHSHAGTAGAAHNNGDDTVAAGSALAIPAVVPPNPYDPTKPIDLGGVEGVTPEQQARAENLVAITLVRLPKYADPATAQADGFSSIGDAGTGYEHFIKWSYINDDKILDPDFPESLVYRVSGTQRTLEAVMFMLSENATLDTVPDVGGALMQWHIHDNLCFSPDPVAPQVLGITRPDGTCPAPLQRSTQVPMIHVWTVPHPCGPFSALEGIGAGQVKPGETKLCDHAHGA